MTVTRISLALFACAALVAAACTSTSLKSVRASDYDQSCNQDADCVLVNDLGVFEGMCDYCSVGAVNARDRQRVIDDVREMSKECPADQAPPRCAEPGEPRCVSGRCDLVPEPVAVDAGTD